MPPGAGNFSLMASVSSRTTSNALKRRLSAASQIQGSSKRKKRLNNKRSEAFTTMATLVNANTTTSPPPDDSLLELSKLKTWIQQQETNPTPLTLAQRKNLTDLISSLKVEEPTLGDKDWVSLLQRFRDAHQQLCQGAIVYDDAIANNKKFTCTVTLNLTSVSPGLDFPNQDIGYVDSSLPTFSRKKDAKRYAAKCCVEWLMRDHYMPSDGQNVSFSPSSEEAAWVNKQLAFLKRSASQPSTAPKPSSSNHALLSTQAQGPSASQLSLNGGAPLEDDSDVQIMQKSDVAGDDGNKEPNIAASKKVIELCNYLGFCAPQYLLTLIDEGRDLYDGRVSFGPDDCKVPDSLGQVRAVYSKRIAKEAVAEQVLVWLQNIKKQREAELEEIYNDLP